jgi:hypothetical protein
LKNGRRGREGERERERERGYGGSWATLSFSLDWTFVIYGKKNCIPLL